MRAWVTFRPHPTARLEPFVKGLERHGFRVVYERIHPEPQDLILTWNRYGDAHEWAKQFEAVGATVLVAENGYIGADPRECSVYAISRGHHNGGGWWFIGHKRRWHKFGIDTEPWRRDGSFVLVLPQRGIGEPGIAMPKGWSPILETNREIRVRKHPGNLYDAGRSLKEDLAGAWAAVTWGSGAGIKAIVHGVPVFYGFPRWIGAPAAKPIGDIEQPFLGSRAEMLHSLSWAQWTVDEIASGEAFEGLLWGWSA